MHIVVANVAAPTAHTTFITAAASRDIRMDDVTAPVVDWVDWATPTYSTHTAHNTIMEFMHESGSTGHHTDCNFIVYPSAPVYTKAGCIRFHVV